MRYEEIIEKLKEILVSADETKRDIIKNCSEESWLVTDIGLTSVNILYMVIAIEEVFEMRFENVSIMDFQKLGDVVEYIAEKKGIEK